MPDPTFLPSQKRALADAMEESGIPLEEFQLISVDGEWAGLIDDTTQAFHHKPTAFTFAFFYMPDFTNSTFGRRIKGGYACAFRPGTDAPYEERRHLTWEDELAAFVHWLALIKREVHAWQPGKYQPAESREPGGTRSHTLSAEEPPPPSLREPESSSTDIDEPAPSPTLEPAKPRAHRPSINEWLETEAKKRGRLWTAIGVILGLLFAALALLR